VSLPNANRSHVLRIAALVVVCAAVLVPASAAPAAVRLVAPAGSDSGNCLAVPCASLRYAYGQAAAGDVVTIAPGSYGDQEVPAGNKPVTFQGLSGNKIRQIVNDADNVTFDGLDLDAGGTKTTGAVLETGGNSGITFKNGRIGNVVDEKGAMIGGQSSPASLNVVFDNVDFHDVVQRSSDVHNECAYAMAAGLTIRNSTFRNCATMDLFVKRGDWWGQQPFGNITLENNIFGHTINGSGWHYYSLYWANDAWSNNRVVNNTFENAVILSGVGGGPYSGVWANNVGGGWSCLSGVTYRGNVGKKCDASDKAVSPSSSCAPPACSPARVMPVGWVNPAGGDFQLAATSPAVNAGSAEHAPATDKLGLPRDSRPDAGAYEFGARAGGPSQPPSGGAPGAGWKLRWARLVPRTICRAPRRGCPSSTKLRLRLGRPAKVSIAIQRVRKGAKPRRVRSLALKRVKLHKAVRIRASRLRAGRYRVVVRATNAAGRRSAPVRLKLRVR
jgi:hypothetical protein